MLKPLFLLYLSFNLMYCVSDATVRAFYHPEPVSGSREELFISEVVSDQNFGHGLNVTAWKTVSVTNESYSVGLMQTGVVVVTAKVGPDKKSFVTQEHVFDLKVNLTDFELFTNWNETERKIEPILVLSFLSDKTPELFWYKITERTLDQFWIWHVHKNVSHLRHFKFEDKHRLILVCPAKSGDVSADLYEFNLSYPNRNFWLSQTLPLSDTANSSAINTFGANLYLSIPQRNLNSVLIYKFHQNRFVEHETIASKGVTQASSFRIGFKSFLAINGRGTGVYQFTKNGIVSEQIENLNLEDVNFWLPVPVKTYRNEVFLIVQHSLHHDTHDSHFLETVIYNFEEKKFFAHDEVPCSHSGERQSGLSCMIDEEDEEGLWGASVLSLGKLLGVVIPHKKASALFMVRTEMKKLKSPVEVEMEMLSEMRKRLQKMIDEQQAQIKEIRAKSNKGSAKSDKSTNSSEFEPVSSAEFKEELRSPPIQVGDLRKQEEISIEDLQKESLTIHAEIEEIKSKLSKVSFSNNSEWHFEELIVNGEVEVQGESHVGQILIETLNEEPANEALNDLVRKSDPRPISGHKTFTDLEVEYLTFDNVNGVKAENLIFNKSGPVLIKGNVIFEKPLIINGELVSKSGKLNDRNLENELVRMKRQKPPELLDLDHIQIEGGTQSGHANGIPVETRFKADITNLSSIRIENLQLDTLRMFSNITVENINGENFDEFLKRLCFTNVDTHIPGTVTIEGVMDAIDLETKTLDDLKFPDDYVLQKSQFSLISGTKTFTSPLKIGELLVTDTINGIRPDEIMTLKKNQTFSEIFTFNDLEVTENFNAGNVSGSYLEDFLKNPLMNETNRVKAKVNFKFLEVQGPVIVSNTFNGIDLERLLSDVVYADEEVAVINAIKAFPESFTVTGGVRIASSAINEIPLDLFVTKDTEQTLNFQTLNGFVGFENLNLGGLYGGVNVTKLDQETVKLTGEQFVSSTLVFENDLSATDFVITKTLNELPVSEYFFTTGDSRLIENPGLVFEDVEAERVVVEGGISGVLTDFSLEEFDARRLSLTRDQIVTGRYELEKLEVERLKSDFVNGESFEKLFDLQYYADKISEMLFEGKLAIKNLHVNGSVAVATLNNVDVSHLNNFLWTNKENEFGGTVIFKGDVVMKDLTTEQFNGVDFSIFTSNIIFKNETDLVFEDFKVFTNGFHVVRMINSERLNDIPVDDILTKTGAQEISGPLNIYGDVVVNFDTEIRGNLNGIPVEYLTNTYQFEGDTIIINEDMVFNRVQYIEKLIVDGNVNGRNLQEFLPNIVYKSEDAKLEGLVIFENTVEIGSDLIIAETINGVDLSEFVEDVVFVTKDEIIDGLVIFTQPVYVEEELMVESNLETQYLMGINISNWNDVAVFIDRGLIPGTLSFESVTIQGDITLKYINDIDFDNLIPLQTDQRIDRTLIFSEITSFRDIPVGNLVNGYKLPAEYENTLLMTSDRSNHLQSRIIFKGNVLVRDNLEMLGLVNGLDLTKVVTTNTDQNLTGIYNFNGRTIMNANLILLGTLNEINMEEWRARSVKTYASYPQEINDHWVVDGGITFKEDVLDGGLIGGLDVRALADKYEEQRLQTFSAQNTLVENYVRACKNVSLLLHGAETQVYFFRYFDLFQAVKFAQNIESVHHFKFLGQNYMLVTESNSCMSFLFAWTQTDHELISGIETGSVVQIISVYDGDLLFFVTLSRENSYCDITGTNVWMIEPDYSFRLLYKLQEHQLLQESLVPGTFYGLLLDNVVMEYRLSTLIETSVRGYRKWSLNSGNLAFVPRGLGTGLALSDGYKLYHLIREDLVVEEDYGYETESYTIGKVVEEINYFLPGRNTDFVVLNVGASGKKRSLTAVAYVEETVLQGSFDHIKIYEDILSGMVFQKIPARKPRSLIGIEFGNNGETLLIFIEDERVVQIFEYKGVQGFKHRETLKLAGSKLVATKLPFTTERNDVALVGIVHNNNMTMIKAVMAGNQISLEKPTCEL